MTKKALIIANSSGFLLKFEKDNVRLLQSLGYEVHFASNINEVVYPFDFNDLKRIGVIFHQIDIARSPYMIKYNNAAYKKLCKIVLDENIDLIHCHTPTGGLLGRLVGRSCCRKNKNLKVVYTAHGFHFYHGAPRFNQIVYRGVEKCLAHATDDLIVINKEDFLAAEKLSLKRGGRVHLIPGEGIDLKEFSQSDEEEKRQLRRANGIDPDTLFILSVGELNLNKNHIVAIEAIKDIVTKNKNVNILYGICGDGFYKEAIQTYVKEQHMDNYVTLFGYQNDIKDFYNMADITIFPSIREGLGMAGIESLAMGVPVIAGDNRGTREYMSDGTNGYIFNPEDSHKLAECIKKYMELGENEKQTIRSNCRRTVERFDRKYTNEIMGAIYRELDQRTM